MSEPAVTAIASADDGVVVRTFADRVVVVEFARGLVIDRTVARTTRELQASITDGDHVVVADLRGIAYADREAREFFSTDPSGMQRAIAVIVGRRISSYVADRWVTDYELDRPVSVFTDPAEALRWARQMVGDLIDPSG